MKKGLSATQLKIIAIIAMTIDHIAWGFVDMFSIPGQIMHIIGRLTIPIMCFFIAEGYRKTSNVKKYFNRMVIFSIITVIPFALFFGEEYGYRQNFFFDLTLALAALIISDYKKFPKWLRGILIAVVVLISATVGGWPVFPIMLVMIFYYVKDFKKVCILVAGSIVAVEATLIPTILLNSIYNFAPQYADWKWYEWLYFFGFVLALPLIKMYNGEKGKYPLGRYFFYAYYPFHFYVLWSIKGFINADYFEVYLAVNIVCLILAVAITAKCATAKPSKAQSAAIIMGMSGVIYVLGFILEINTPYVEMAYAGTIVEYFGECIVFMSFFWFITEISHVKPSKFFYLITGAFSVAIIYLVFSAPRNGLFYSNISMDFSGPFHRISLMYGPGFYVFFAYMVFICGACLALIIMSLKKSFGIEKKRLYFLLGGIICPWAALGARNLGLTGGYEISAIGVLGSIFCMYMSLVRYGFFNSMQLAGENALHQFDEGVLVVSATNRILYVNKKMQSLYPKIMMDCIINNEDEIGKMVLGELTEFSLNGHYYEVSNIPLVEGEYIQGHMICLRDMTVQHNHLKETEKYANTDSLTSLSNRAHFKKSFEELQKNITPGYVLMIDLDNFKKVNDDNGHGVGDEVLIALADVLRTEACSVNLFGRIGGDEFCGFIGSINDDQGITEFGERLIARFSELLKERNLENITSISVGAAYFDGNIPIGGNAQDVLSTIYRLADEALYDAKKDGKKTCRVYKA